MQKRILIVDDEPAIRDMVAYALRKGDFDPVLAGDAREAQAAISERVPDLILLDWMLPGTSGLELARRWRREALTRDIPMGLATGAYDYLVKPFSVPELLARVRTILRRANPDAVAEVLKAGDIALDRRARRVTRSKREIELSPTEFRLLEHLMQNPGRVYSRSQLLDAVWGRDIYVDERTVDVHVGRLRKSLQRGRESDPIRTVRSMGYAFDERFGAA